MRAAAPMVSYEGHRMPAEGWDWAPSPMGTSPSNSDGAHGLQTLPQKPLGSKPDDLSTFFPNTSSSPPRPPHLPISQCLWIPSLWCVQGRPEGPGGAPSRGCSVSTLPAWPASWDIRQRNHTSCCCLGEHQSGFPRQQPLEPAVRCRQLTAQCQASPASGGQRGKRSTLVSEVRKAWPGDLGNLPARGEQDECLGG